MKGCQKTFGTPCTYVWDFMREPGTITSRAYHITNDYVTADTAYLICIDVLCLSMYNLVALS